MKYKNILVITSRYPYPVRGGDKLRIDEIIKNLSKKNKIDLVSIGNTITKKKYINKQFIFKNTLQNKIYQTIKSILLKEPMQIGLYKVEKMKRKIISISKNYDAIIFHLIRAAYYLPLNYKGKKILEMTDLISKNYDTVKKNTGLLSPIRLIYNFEKKNLKIFEDSIIKHFDSIVFVNKKDLNQKLLNNKKTKIIGNGTKIKKNIFLNNSVKDNIIFFGNINSLANMTACIDLIKNYLPSLNKKIPRIKLIILGNCSLVLKIFFNFLGAKVYSNIKDLSNYTKKTLAGVCNVKIQSGLQNKILDYTSIGLPVLANKISNNFKYLKSHDILIFKNKKDFLKKVELLKNNKKLQKKLSTNCFNKTKKFYSWEIALKNYESLL